MSGRGVSLVLSRRAVNPLKHAASHELYSAIIREVGQRYKVHYRDRKFTLCMVTFIHTFSIPEGDI